MGTRREAGNTTGNSAVQKKKTSLAIRIVGWSAAVLLVLYLALKIFLATPYAADLASVYLGRILQQKVSVTGISLSGMSLSIRGITLENPKGFAVGPFATVGFLRIKPDLTGFMAGKKSFSLMQADGLRIVLVKNLAGEWNCGNFIRLLTRKKKRPAAEFFVGKLVLNDMSLKTGELSLEKVSLTLHDLSTRGMANSKLVLTGTDGKGNPFRVAAEGRLGKNPDMRLSIAAPELSLGALGNGPSRKPVFSLGNGTAGLLLSAGYRNGNISLDGHVSCDGLGVIVKGRNMPLRGIMDFAVHYSIARDEAELDRCSLLVNDKVRLNASGAVLHVKGEKEFRLVASSDDIRLRDIISFFPRETFGDTALSGSLKCRELQLGGSRTRGITSGRGSFSLRNGELVKSGRAMFRGLHSDIEMSRAAGGWNVGGTIAVNARAGKVPLEHLDARFNSRFSNVFKLLSIEIPALKAEVRGVPVHGHLTYTPGNANPYTCALTAKSAPLPVFNDLVATNNFVISTGTADISLQASGRGPASFSGEGRVRMSGVNGAVSGKVCALGAAEITSRFTRSGARLAAAGTAGVDAGRYSGNSFSGAFAYSLSDGGFSLTGGKAVINQSKVKFADFSGRIPVREAVSAGARYPLSFKAGAVDVEAGKTRISDLSGSMEGFCYTDAKGRRLEGSAVLDIHAFSWRSRPIGAVKALVALDGEGAVAKVNGTALDGALTSVVTFEPFLIKKGVSFNGALRDARTAELSGLLPEMFPLRFPSGKFNGDMQGTWSSGEGLRWNIDALGNDLTLVAKNGKTLITGVGLDFRADFTGANISVREATIRKGEGVALKISGNIANASSPSRKGKFSLELEKRPVNSLLAGLSDLLPKPLQQSNAGGSLGLGGILGVDGGKILLEGSLQFDNVLVDFPAQKVSVTGVDGGLPFSIYLSGGAVEKPVETMSFSRGNYPVLLDALRREIRNGKKGVLLKIGKVRFGPLETGDIKVYAKSGNGMVGISSFESTLYSGTVMGRGFMFYRGGFNYGADLLINDMSLRQFCNSYPALKGYISGKLDGVVSLYGEKGGIPAMVGFVDLWARKGKGEDMIVSKEFLQRLAGRKLRGFFFRDDRPYDNGEISAFLLNGDITFEKLDLSHTNFLGMKDLSVSVAPVQNRIGLSNLFQTIREAAKRGKPAAGEPPAAAPVQPDVKWLE